jgi:GTPase Era involved in 16S rRNA processing
MSFFNSDVVRSEIAEISDLQEEVYTNVFNFSKMNKESQLNHVNLLQRLLEKQRVLYTRLSLSDDPEAVEMKERIAESATMMGLPPGTDMSIIFKNMSDLIEVMRQQIDKTEFDQ